METKKIYKVEYNGENIWNQCYQNQKYFESEAEADEFIKTLEANNAVYQIFKVVTTAYCKMR